MLIASMELELRQTHSDHCEYISWTEDEQQHRNKIWKYNIIEMVLTWSSERWSHVRRWSHVIPGRWVTRVLPPRTAWWGSYCKLNWKDRNVKKHYNYKLTEHYNYISWNNNQSKKDNDVFIDEDINEDIHSIIEWIIKENTMHWPPLIGRNFAELRLTLMKHFHRHCWTFGSFLFTQLYTNIRNVFT